MRTFALVPAAGHSRRMGRPKLGLPLGNGTVLGCVVTALRQGGVDDVLVVIGPHVPDLEPLARTAGASVLLLEAETPDMRTTVEHGLLWFENNRQPEPEDNWLLCPADHPTLESEIVRGLIAHRREHPEKSVIIPTFQGRRGHPALIGWTHVVGIRELPPDQGLNVYLRGHASETWEMAVDSEVILHDLDTPEQYEKQKELRPLFQASKPLTT